MIWEILSHLGSDYILLFKYPLRLPTFVYFISRSAIKLTDSLGWNLDDFLLKARILGFRTESHNRQQ